MKEVMVYEQKGIWGIELYVGETASVRERPLWPRGWATDRISVTLTL